MASATRASPPPTPGYLSFPVQESREPQRTFSASSLATTGACRNPVLLTCGRCISGSGVSPSRPHFSPMSLPRLTGVDPPGATAGAFLYFVPFFLHHLLPSAAFLHFPCFHHLCVVEVAHHHLAERGFDPRTFGS